MRCLNLIFLSLLLGEISLASLAAGEPVEKTYYVVPSTSSCQEDHRNYPCYTLDNYLDNTTELFTKEMDITMIFLNGTHFFTESAIEVPIIVSSLRMRGQSQDVLIRTDSEVEMANLTSWSIRGTGFYMENLTISNLKLEINVDILNISSLIFLRNVKVHIFQLSFKLNASIIDSEFHDRSRTVFEGNNLRSDDIATQLLRCRFQNYSFLKVVSISNISISHTHFLDIPNSPNYTPLLTAYYSTLVFTDVCFDGGNQTALQAYSSELIFHGTMNFTNNVGYRGGALALYSTRLYIDNEAVMNFVNNSALVTGGAIYLNEDLILTPDRDFESFYCFYQVLQPTESDSYVFNFVNNSARFGGNDIYGTALNGHCLISSNGLYHLNSSRHFSLSNNDNLSSVSGNPSRVCVCVDDKPLCAGTISSIFINLKIYPGETVSLPVMLAGGDFGATVGAMYADFLDSTKPVKINNAQKSQAILLPQCTDLNFTFYADDSTDFVMYLSPFIYSSKERVQNYYEHRSVLKDDMNTYHESQNNTIKFLLLTTPIFIEFTTLSCPPGFVLKNSTSECVCNPRLLELFNDLQCFIDDKHAFIEWTGRSWIGVDSNTGEAQYSTFCLYCNESLKRIDVLNNTALDIQCPTNRVGKLCGECKNGYSLAIGSSRCIPCSNNNNIALVLFFAFAGLLLVFVICVVNLTVSQGMINGLIFYANIVWVYQRIIIPSHNSIPVFTLVLAWLNLDFGIETCFINHLNVLAKTWLQFVFPFYTAGLFFIGLRFSEKLCTLVGDRSVPTLATLLFLSHSNLLRTIIQAVAMTQIDVLSNGNSTSADHLIVWAFDGSISYGSPWHGILLLVALLCFCLLWLPYTVLLLYMQWLRKLPNSRLSRWITRYKPFFDTYYAPLKEKHHYWFGVLLTVQGVLLILSSLVDNVDQINLFIVLIVIISLLFYMNFMQVYQHSSVLITESLFFINLILLIGGIIYFADDYDVKVIFFSVSVTFVCLKLLGIVIWSVAWTYCCNRKMCAFRGITKRSSLGYASSQKSLSGATVSYRDSIFNDSNSLIQDSDTDSEDKGLLSTY